MSLDLRLDIHSPDGEVLRQTQLEVAEAIAAHPARETHHGRLADLRLSREGLDAGAGRAFDILENHVGDATLRLLQAWRDLLDAFDQIGGAVHPDILGRRARALKTSFRDRSCHRPMRRLSSLWAS